MPFVSEKEVNEALKPYFPDMVSLVTAAFNDWTSSQFAASMQDPKVRANIVWNQFLYRAKAHFEDHGDVQVQAIQHWSGLVIGGSFFVRMKKGGAQLLSRNYPTRSALDFNDATVDMFDGVARLELLYGLDTLCTSINKIVIAQRHRNKILWAIDILNADESSAQTVIPMPAPDLGGTPAERMIKPKKKKVSVLKKRGTDDGA